MKESVWNKTRSAYAEAIAMWKQDPVIWALFGVMALLDAAALLVLYLAPCPPFSYVVAPIIRTFWDESYLHYPNNFILLPKLFTHAHFLVGSVAGIFVSGIIVKKIEARLMRNKIGILQACGSVLRRYFAIFFAWILSYGAFTSALKALMPLFPSSIGVQIGCAFILGLFFQTLVAFILPVMLTAKEGFFKSLLGAVRFALANLTLTSVILCAPVFVVVVFSFLKNVAPLYVRVWPEAVLWVLFLGIGVLTLVDLFVTSVTACVYMKNRVNKHEINMA